MALPSYEAWTKLLQEIKQKQTYTAYIGSMFYGDPFVALSHLDTAIKVGHESEVKFACNRFLFMNKPGSSVYAQYGEIVEHVLFMIVYEGLAKKESSLPPDLTLKRFKCVKTPEEIAKRNIPAKKWALSSESELEQYKQPANYTSRFPFAVYLALQNKWQQKDDESEHQWAIRIRQACFHPDNNEYVQSLMPFAGTDFKAQLEASSKSKDWGAGAMKRDELHDGMARVAPRQLYTGGGAGVKAQALNWNKERERFKLASESYGGKVTKFIDGADTYTIHDNALRIREFDASAPMVTTSNAITAPVESIYAGKDERENFVLKQLVTATNVDTPKDGSVFWNGIDCCRLADRVNTWNREQPGLFGQLEATTDVRHVNGQFVWGGKVEEYFQKTSGNLGHRASGAMTAAVMWAFRDTSILTFAELPAILYGMAEELAEGKVVPRVTSLSIVLIDPLINPDQDRVKIVNNIDILNCPVYGLAEGRDWAEVKDHCTVISTLGTYIIPEPKEGKPRHPKTGFPVFPALSTRGGALLQSYLAALRPDTPTPAALHIKNDVEKIVYKTYTFST